MAKVPFSKMQATGNDFVLIDNREALFSPDDLPELAREVSNRKFGVGSDGLILLEDDGGSELRMIYKNPDGSDAGMCGNGARCFVRFAHQLGYEGQINFLVHENRYLGSEKGEKIEVQFPLETSVQRISVDGKKLFQVYTNTEHIVCSVEKGELGDELALIEKGRALRNHEMFAPLGTNVNFIAGTSADEVELQTYERGVEDLTLACGTGAIASSLAWHYLKIDKPGTFSMSVQVRGGTLNVFFEVDPSDNNYKNIRLGGPAATVFEGIYYY